jgi:hypothetical protein
MGMGFGGPKRIQKNPNFMPQNDFNSGKFNQMKKPLNPQNYKIVKCKNFESGSCKYGDNCTFAHGDEEVRSKTENSFNNPNFQPNMGSYGFPQGQGFPNQMNFYPQMDFNNYQMMNQENDVEQNMMFNYPQGRMNNDIGSNMNPNLSSNYNPMMNSNNVGSNSAGNPKFQYIQENLY